MKDDLQDKIALVTGSSRGIGKAIAFRLAEKGARLAINYVRNDQAAQETVQALRQQGTEADAFRANVGDIEEAENLIDQVAKKFGTIDILVHNAAIGAFKPLHKLRPNQWDISLEINTRAFLVLTQKAIPLMEKRGEGNIIAISSLGASRFIPNYGAIGVSKAALECLVRYLAAELAPKGIRVNAVSGGAVETEALKSFPSYEMFKQEVIRQTPAGRLGEPDDLARVVAFLVTPAAAWIYGQTLVADGGLSLA